MVLFVILKKNYIIVIKLCSLIKLKLSQPFENKTPRRPHAVASIPKNHRCGLLIGS